MLSQEVLEKLKGRSVAGFIQSLKDGSANVERYPTGFPTLDAILGGGLIAGALYIIQAESTIGKTSLCLQMSSHWAKAGKTVLYFNLDNPGDSINYRMISREYYEVALTETGNETKAKAKTKTIYELMDRNQREQMTTEERTLWEKAISAFEGYQDNIYFFESVQNIEDLKKTVEKAIKALGDDAKAVVVVDYLQKVPGDGKDEREDLTGIVKGLSSIRQCPVVALSSTPKSAQGATRASKTDGFGTVAILYDAYVIMGLIKEGDFIKLSILKNKDGEANRDVSFRFLKERGFFTEMGTGFDAMTEQEVQMRAFQQMMG